MASFAIHVCLQQRASFSTEQNVPMSTPFCWREGGNHFLGGNKSFQPSVMMHQTHLLMHFFSRQGSCFRTIYVVCLSYQSTLELDYLNFVNMDLS